VTMEHNRRPVELRPMTESDAPSAVDVWCEAQGAMATRFGLDHPERTEAWDRRMANRICHFLGTDPVGSFVAEQRSSVIGFAQSFVRDGYWVLSLLATLPGQQGKGIGRALIERTLDTADRRGPGTIQSSRDPSAMALYSACGFSLHPALFAEGPARRPVVGEPAVRHGGGGDLALVGEVDLARRGSVRTVDIAHMLSEPGNRLLVLEGRGYAVAQAERLVTLGALDDQAARALLRTALAEARPGAPFEVGWLTSSQQWAIETLVEAGLAFHPYGAVMVRGMSAPPSPYIPSGGFG